MKTHAILLAAGSGTRLRARTPKAFAPYFGTTLLAASYQLLASLDPVVVVPARHLAATRALLPTARIVAGGATRLSSLRAGITALGNIAPKDIVVVHNAANPRATPKELRAVAVAARTAGAALCGHFATSTVRHHHATLPREAVFLAETPQALRGDVLAKALTAAASTDTDEGMLAERIGIQPTLIPASPANRKVTFPSDLPAARIGCGVDAHAAGDQPLTLCGIRIADTGGYRANSDGDAALHALCNALLSAIQAGSFSRIADPLCKRGIRDSRQYLAACLTRVRRAGLAPISASIGLVCAAPKLEPHIEALQASVSHLLGAPVGVTVTSGEGLLTREKGHLGIFATAEVILLPC